MESIIRNDDRQKVTLADFYANIDKGKDCPEFYRHANLLIGSGEEEPDACLILETLGKGGIGFVFLAFFQRKLTAVKMTYGTQKDEHIFSTVKKIIGDEYRDYFLTPGGKTVNINSFYLGKLNEENKHYFDREITITLWEPADAMLSEKLDESFENKLKWFRQFLNGLRIIHSRDRAHFDIKLDNLFLVGNRLKIGDFEFYYKIEDFKKSDLLVGTAGHIAPEMFVDHEHISTKVDIFSAGIAFAQLFTGKSALDVKREATKVPAGHPLSTKGHEEEGLKKIFLKNHSIYEFFKTMLESRLDLSQFTAKEKEIFRLLLWMMEISPNKRPDAEVLLKEINVISGGSNMETGRTAESIAEEISTEKYEDDAFSRLLQTHDKRGVIKYCLVPDLIDKLKSDKIKKKIMGVRFEGDDYDKRFFSFCLVDKETKIQLSGKEITSREYKDYKEWNVLVIVDYWNKSFQLGLEKTCDKKYIDALVKGKELDDVDKDIFQGWIKETRKQLIKALRVASRNVAAEK
jgi:serine/threonine protein kinase